MSESADHTRATGGSTGFRGIYAIPLTPFSPDGGVDHAALNRVVEYCLAGGAHGLVMPANVSEFFTLTDEERIAVVATTVRAAAGRVPVVAGVSGASLEQARELARRARIVGADAVIALPPYIRRGSWPDVFRYYEGIAAACELPVFVQNAEGPTGTPMSANQLLDLVSNIDGVSWIKEETLRSSHLITEVLREGSGHVSGVMGGKGSRYLLDEYARGVCGTMPACEFIELHVALWAALEAGDSARAADIYRVLLPLATMEDQYGAAVLGKEVLRKRGVISCTTVREPGHTPLDPVAIDVLNRHLTDATTYLATVAAAGHEDGNGPAAPTSHA